MKYLVYLPITLMFAMLAIGATTNGIDIQEDLPGYEMRQAQVFEHKINLWVPAGTGRVRVRHEYDGASVTVDMFPSSGVIKKRKVK